MNRATLPLALALAFSLGACSQNAADQPENMADDAPSIAAPSDRTADISAPSANDSADATARGSLTDQSGSTGMGTTGDSALGDTATGTSAMGGTSTGGNAYNANLEEELQRCDQLNGAERDTCRTDAQDRYAQSSTPTQP